MLTFGLGARLTRGIVEIFGTLSLDGSEQTGTLSFAGSEQSGNLSNEAP